MVRATFFFPPPMNAPCRLNRLVPTFLALGLSAAALAADPKKPAPTPAPAPVLAKTTQTIGGIRTEATRLSVIFEDTSSPINRQILVHTPTPTPAPSSGGTDGTTTIVASGFSYSNVAKPMPPEKKAFREKLAKDLEKNLAGRFDLDRAGQGGKATHEDSFREITYHASIAPTDAILWVTDLNSPFTRDDVEQLAKVLNERKIRLYILSTQYSPAENTPYRKDSAPGRLLMDLVRQSGGSFRSVKL